MAFREARGTYSAPASPGATHVSEQFNKGIFQAQSSTRLAVSYVPSRTFHPDASLVLVGVRGSGKRSLGLIAATALGRRFVTEDHYFQSTTGLSRQDYLKVHGSEEFHKQDVEITRQMLEQHGRNCVIDCGLGSMTSSLQAYLKQYRLTNPVVYLMRDDEQIRSLLNLGDRSAKLLQSADPSHRRCSNYEYYNLQEDAMDRQNLEEDVADPTSPSNSFKLRQTQAAFPQFARFVTGNDINASTRSSPFSIDSPLEGRMYTHALQMRLSDFKNDLLWDTLEAAGDIMEVAIDSWDQSDAKKLSKVTASVRRYLSWPILFSVRLNNISPGVYIRILHHVLRLGPEYMAINLDLDSTAFAEVAAACGQTKIIGELSASATASQSWTDPTLVSAAQKAAGLNCSLIRVVLASNIVNSESSVFWFKEELKHQYGISLPIIAYSSGKSGFTRLTNEILSPVSQTKPGTVMQTAVELNEARFASFLLDALNFHIVGGNVSASLSPCMHNAAYAALGLRHRYSTTNISSWEDIAELARSESLGGCSVVQPWKVRVVSQLTSMSDDARMIGAVNTLMPLKKQADGLLMSLAEQARYRNRAAAGHGWHGENTDFIGIMVCLGRSLSPRNVVHAKTSGLVIGAGGMARAAVYAMLQMGCRTVFVYNRTLSNARLMADHFNKLGFTSNGPGSGIADHQVHVLESLEHAWPVASNPPTMIVSCVTHELLDGNPGSDFEMPIAWLQSPSGGAVIEMAYMTRETALVRQMKKFRGDTGLPWVTVDGIETLIEQAIAQFQIMTGRRAPRKVMTDAIRAALRANQEYVADGEEYVT
jgi:shikimate 5-dehydrogenase/shikimate kinase